VVLGGGQDAMNVTMTDRCAGKSEAKFYHKVSLSRYYSICVASLLHAEDLWSSKEHHCSIRYSGSSLCWGAPTSERELDLGGGQAHGDARGARMTRRLARPTGMRSRLL
jgi:hypothetical protein